jgi:signal transduction histidine kinase
VAWYALVALAIILFIAVPGGLRTSDGLQLVFATVLTVLPAPLLRRWPLPALVLIMAISFTATAALRVHDIAYLPVLAADLAVAFIAATRSGRISIVAAAMALVAQIAAGLSDISRSHASSRPIPFAVVAIVAAWVIGYSIRERRMHADALRVQESAQAATAERLRIARELHDMIAHSIAIIAIQAGVGSRVMETQPVEARNALDIIETTSRETLAGLRRTLGTLRRADSGPGSDPAPLEPAPGLADLDRLAASTLDAGVRVDVRWRGQRRPIPADIDLSAYRIIQEALTNVVRHADTGACQVTVDYRDDDLLIEVTDRGRGGGELGTGFGIVGMRERVGLLHGDLTAEPRLEGGFRVAARLPMPATLR